MNTNVIHTDDALDRLAELSEDSVHAVVTDPPYGLAFMGRDWDDFEPREYQTWCERWASLALDVLKPGGHLLAFSGNRTHHRLFSGVEDAGFEIRDTLTWHYGSGFPKALDVSKAIDKAAGAEREVVGEQRGNGIQPGHGNYVNNDESTWNGDGFDKTAPATDAAREWDGWKTALKPATEFIVLARAPLGESTVAENVQEHGTGALNIDGCRIGTEQHTYTQNGMPQMVERDNENTESTDGFSDKWKPNEDREVTRTGRYPANVIFDAEAAEALDQRVGELSAGHYTGEDTDGYGERRDYDGPGDYTETGGPSRYFYTSKATRAERTLDGRIDNAHPTVKPQDLMEWLVRLVTREGQIVLDPFAGTGTTCAAAKDLGRQFVGIEKQAKWADVARARIGLAPEDPSHVRASDEQRGLNDFPTTGDDD